MMKKTWATALFAAACIFTANAQNRFVSETPQNRHILLEEYTAIHCGNCPDGHKIAGEILAKHPQQVFLMNVHGTALATPVGNDVDLRSPYGEDLIEQAGVEKTGIPAGSVNRHIFSSETATALRRDFWEERIEEMLAMPTYVNIAAKGKLDWANRELSVTVQLYYTGTPSTSSNFIHVAVLQDSIIGRQNGENMNPAQVLPDKSYLHMHVFRHFLTGQWGEEIKTQGAGQLIEKTFTQTLPEKIGNVDLNLFDLQFIAFVSENKEEIMDVCPVETENLNRPDRIVSLSQAEQTANPSCDKNVRFSLLLQNHALSTEPITELVLECSGKAGKLQQTYHFSEPVQVGQERRFETQTIRLAKANRKEDVSFRIVSVNGGAFMNRKQNVLEASAIKHYGITENPDITLSLQQDRFGGDITWVLKDEENDTVAQGGPYQNLSANETLPLHTYPLTIAEGCHTFTVYDKNHDGIGEGFIRFSEKDDRIFAQLDGNYKDSAVIMFRIGEIEIDTVPEDPDPVDTLALQSEKAPLLHLYPNPCKDVIHIQAPNNTEIWLYVRILSAHGQEVLRRKGNVREINIERLPAGLYLLEVRTAQGAYRTKLLHR
ncbi:MAG: Omp28-related outer membrane protein [Bacteroidales bacterium]|nr:Omp28-related outer membrane protein [Bacteroidales bacterium]